LWCGYLDTELYTEPFDSLTNYPVSFTANDGFNLLDRLSFVDNDGNNYSGQKTQFELLILVLSRLGLPYNDLYIGLSTTSADVSIYSNTTLLHGVYVNCGNFYDESNEACTLREVLNSILNIYGATIIQDNGNVYIYDLNTILSSPAAFKKYNDVTGAYVATVNLTTDLGDLSTIKFTSTSQNLELIPAINKQKIKYSCYNIPTVSSFSASENDMYGSSSYSDFGTDNADYKFREFTFSLSKSLTQKYIYGSLCQMKGIGNLNQSESAYYIKHPTTNNFAYTYEINYKPHLYAYAVNVAKPVYYLKVSCKAYFRSKTYEGKPDELAYDDLRKASLYIQLKAGGQVAWNASNTFSASGSTPTIYNSIELQFCEDYNYNTTIADQWVTNKVQKPYQVGVYQDYRLIPLTGYIHAPLQVRFLLANSLKNKANADVTANIKDIRISELKIEISDSQGNTIANTDMEFIGYIDPLNKNNGADINLINGINLNEYPTQQASLFNSGFLIKSFARAGNTARIEELLLNTVISNFENPSIKLTVDSNKLSSAIGYISYNNYLPDKQLVPQGITFDFENDSNQLSLIESLEDNLTLNIT